MPPVRRLALPYALRASLGALSITSAVTAGLLAGTALPAAAGVAPAPAPTAKESTALRIGPGSRTVTTGSRVDLAGRLISGGHYQPNSRIDFYRRTSSRDSWHFVTSGTTNAHGLSRRPFTATHTYQWTARYVGDSARKPAASPIETIRVVASLGQRAVAEASRHRGQPYQYGAAGPDRFDCSGLTKYVFGRLGRSLPHNAQQQYSDIRHVAPSQKRAGDLIFFHDSSGHVYHVGIYAGSGKLWHAPHSGDVVRLAAIWTSSYYVGRVG